MDDFFAKRPEVYYQHTKPTLRYPRHAEEDAVPVAAVSAADAVTMAQSSQTLMTSTLPTSSSIVA